MKKLGIIIVSLFFVEIMFAQDIPFTRNIDMQNNEIKNVNKINGKDATTFKDSTEIEGMIDETVSFDFLDMGIDPTAMGFGNSLRYDVEITQNASLQIFNNEAKVTVVSWYLYYTGQPTVTITPPPGGDIVWGAGIAYTGPTVANSMDIIIVATLKNNKYLVFPALIGTPAPVGGW